MGFKDYVLNRLGGEAGIVVVVWGRGVEKIVVRGEVREKCLSFIFVYF